MDGVAPRSRSILGVCVRAFKQTKNLYVRTDLEHIGVFLLFFLEDFFPVFFYLPLNI